MACCTENELLELAEGLLPAGRAASITRHVDACSECRAVLAGIARATTDVDPPPTAAVAAAVAAAAEALPAGLLRAHLAADAARRERIATALVGGLAVFSIGTLQFVPPEGAAFARAGTVIQLVLLAYELGLHLALRRGWFHRAVPLVNACVEVSVFFAMQLAARVTVGAETLRGNPALVGLGALIVFTAIRFEPRICIAAGALAAIESFPLFLRLEAGGSIVPIAPFALAGAILRATFCAFAGAAGVILARYLLGRSEQALRDARAQDLFGKYILHERIGAGGMGEVFRATYCPEGGFTKVVAVKRVAADAAEDPRFVDALRAEARLGAALVHPNLVQLLDCGTYRGAFVVAMEYVDGLSLSALLRRAGAPLDPSAVVYLGAELAGALAYVHAKKGPDGCPLTLVHCDVNPPNVLLSRIGEVKLGDFGVARASGPRAGGAPLGGKVPYAAPEQLRGDALDARTDLYALGLTLHEALTGKRARPVKGGADPDAPIAPASELRPDVPPELDALISSLVASDPARRPASAEVVRATLRALDGPLRAYPDGEERLAKAVEAALGRR